MVLKSLVFPKNYETSPSGWGLRLQTRIVSGVGGSAPQTPVCDTLNYSTLLYSNTSPNLDIWHFNCWFKPSFLNEFLVMCQHQAGLLVFHPTISLPPQKIPCSKFLMTLLHWICGLGSLQSKILAMPMWSDL